MNIGIEIKPEHLDSTVAIISASLVPVAMEAMIRHIQATGDTEVSEEQMDDFREVALGQWMQMFTMVKSKLTVRSSPPFEETGGKRA